jgi:hypothetical protein
MMSGPNDPRIKAQPHSINDILAGYLLTLASYT